MIRIAEMRARHEKDEQTQRFTRGRPGSSVHLDRRDLLDLVARMRPYVLHAVICGGSLESPMHPDCGLGDDWCDADDNALLDETK